jgi:hypothetical protein
MQPAVWTVSSVRHDLSGSYRPRSYIQILCTSNNQLDGFLLHTTVLVALLLPRAAKPLSILLPFNAVRCSNEQAPDLVLYRPRRIRFRPGTMLYFVSNKFWCLHIKYNTAETPVQVQNTNWKWRKMSRIPSHAGIKTLHIKKYRCASVSAGNTFQDLPRLRETVYNTESYI